MHFTYAPPDKTQLQQGDILWKSEPIQAILSGIHPYYGSKVDYRFFMVLTQSCDLIRRGGQPCAGRYITVAAVRPIAQAFERFTDQLLYREAEATLHFCQLDRQQKLRSFAERLLNNNEDDYFYLRGQPDTPLATDHCTFLKLSVALKRAHYDTLLAAKVLQLQLTFQHKLGELVGRSYSRVGTEEWPVAEMAPVVSDHVKSGAAGVFWLEKDIYQHVLSRLEKMDRAHWTPQSLTVLIQEAKTRRGERRQEFLKLVRDILLESGVDGAVATDIVKKLDRKPQLRGFLKVTGA